MAAQDAPQQIDFPKRIGKTAQPVLFVNGYTTFAQLTETTPAERWNTPGATGILTLRCHRDSNRRDHIWTQPNNQTHPSASRNLQPIAAAPAA